MALEDRAAQQLVADLNTTATSETYLRAAEEQHAWPTRAQRGGLDDVSLSPASLLAHMQAGAPAPAPAAAAAAAGGDLPMGFPGSWAQPEQREEPQPGVAFASRAAAGRRLRS